MGDDIEKTLKDKEGLMFRFFAPALDETTDITNTAHTRGFVEPMNGTTPALDETTDITNTAHTRGFVEPMNGTTRAMVGSQKGLTTVVKKNDSSRSCCRCHYTIYQLNLCVKSLQLRYVMSTVRWMSRSDMLTSAYLLQSEIIQFMNMQGKPVAEVSEWLCDLVFMVDISKLNMKLQEPNQYNLQNNDTTHFPTLQEQKPSTTAEYARECEKISEAFIERFQDMKYKQMELDIFAALFNVTAAAVPSKFQHEIIELQYDDTLKGYGVTSGMERRFETKSLAASSSNETPCPSR
ncbi:general transcription factor II-I repeat domain-containing protein 2-like [Clavelina lepadiformis]|uniref:general transcription factor II-I repeat domain-containing protein 2-like n=1 Tax=Clavelina lepadiformis TaxID=159417 RepID=UPI0040413009